MQKEQQRGANDDPTKNRQELFYLKKYKKAKKHLKLLLKEKREVDDRNCLITNENQLLQSHLEKTAQSAQEVSNNNTLMRSELHVQKLIHSLRQLFRVSQ